MTRERERVRGPSEVEEHHRPGGVEEITGEQPDSSAIAAMRLAYSAIRQFPDLARRHKTFVGSVAVVSSVLVLMAGIAVARRVRRGQTPEQILAELTPEEIESASRWRSFVAKGRRGLRRVRRRNDSPTG